MPTISNSHTSRRRVTIQEKILHGPPKMEVPNISLGQFFLSSMRAKKENTFQINVETGQQITNKDVLLRSIKLAKFLEARGIGISDRVSISGENHLYYLIPVCATIYVGGVIVPLNPAYTEWELKNILKISKPKIMFVTRRTERQLKAVAAGLPWPMEIIQIDDEAFDPNVRTLNSILEADGSSDDVYTYKPVEIENCSRQPAAILCSSGTTGFPKGVTLSHRNFMSFLTTTPTPDIINIQEGDRLLVSLPFFHGYAFGLMTMTLVCGVCAVVMQSFHIEVFLSTIQKYKITHLNLVPPMLVLLAKHPSVANYDFSSVREVLCGAAPLPKDVLGIVKKRMKHGYIRNAYGMTELSVITTICERSNEDELGTVGYLYPGLLCKVIDNKTHETLGVGQVGELWFKGDTVMLGYYDNTNATLQTIDENGWLHSGDLGYYDEAGRLFVSGRLKELIKYKGYQVSPSEIETVLLSHSGVKNAAVIGKPDEVSGELPMAFVVRQPGSTVTADEIVQFVNKKLSPQKWLRGGVRFIENIPKTASGKILRKELAKLNANL